MINKKLIYAFLLGTTIFTSSGCSKWLDVVPQDGLIQQEFWKTKEQVNSAVTGAYIALTENSVLNQLFRWGELRGDMIAFAPAPATPSSDEVNVVEGNILPVNSIADWSNIYKVINICNLIADKAPLARNTDPTFSLELLNSRIAEVKAIRALMYFYLVRTFKEVPLQLEGVSEDTQIKSRAKSSSEEILDQILKDLAFAEENIPVSYGSSAANKGRITKWAVNAMQADVYLWMDKFVEANAACDKIIESNSFGLIEGIPGYMFQQLYYLGNSTESIFEFQYTNEKPNTFVSMFISPRTIIANSETVDALFPRDNNQPTIQDLRADMVAFNPTEYTILKYVYTGTGNDYRPAAESIAHFIIYRYADVLLMKAEALAHLEDGAGAIKLINQVRSRAKALQASASNPDINSPASLDRYILDERARELAFEGKRWFDLLRIAKRNNYANKEILIDAATRNTPPARQQSYKIRLIDPNSHYMPVPFRDMQANKDLVQNPFYR